ncbi:MAG: hypothetical protein RRY95_02205 [Oscillospiraceae bacterium]
MRHGAFLGDGALFAAGRFPDGVIWLDRQLPMGVPDLLTVTTDGCAWLADRSCACRTLLIPGDCGEAIRRVAAERVVTYGISPRSSLTFSSMGNGQRVLCIQRTLVRGDGTVIEPREMPLPEGFASLPDEGILAVLGTHLLL